MFPQIFCPFSNWIFFNVEILDFFIYSRCTNYKYYILFCSNLSFNSLIKVFCWAKYFNYDAVHLISFLFCKALSLCLKSKKSSPQPQSLRFLLMLSSKSFKVLYFTFKPVIHFSENFCKVWSLDQVSLFINRHPINPAPFVDPFFIEQLQ